MRIPVSAHTEQPWRIHEIAPDFHVEDVWSYRTPGAGPDDFPIMLAAVRAQNVEDAGPLVRLLFAIRLKLGSWLGWDDTSVAAISESLCDRLPADQREVPVRAKENPNDPFTTIYELNNECAEELANRTVHGVCHLGWVPTRDGEYELRMAVLVKPNGLLGNAYMAAIAPFRHLIVYPALTRQWERAWLNRAELLPGRAGASKGAQS